VPIAKRRTISIKFICKLSDLPKNTTSNKNLK